MPSIMVPLDSEEFNRLRDRARDELRHPRHAARLILREALKLPARELRTLGAADNPAPARGYLEPERVPA